MELRSYAIQSRDYGEALHLSGFEGLQKNLIVLENNTAIRVPLRPKHIGMREEASPSKYLAAVHRLETQRPNSMKGLFPKRKFVDVRRRGAPHPFMDIARVVEPHAEPGVRFQLGPVWKVDSAGRDVIDSRPSVKTLQGTRSFLETG